MRVALYLALLALSGCVGFKNARAVISNQVEPPRFIEACIKAAPRAGFALREESSYELVGNVVRDRAPDRSSAVVVTIDPKQAQVEVRVAEEAARIANRLQTYAKEIAERCPGARLEFLEVDREVIFDASRDAR